MVNKRGLIIGIIGGVFLIVIALFFLGNMKIFYFLVGSAVLIIFLPFVISSIAETKTERDKDDMFLEFTRALVQNVESGTPVSKSIINMKSKNFGSLSPHIEKLANQIELGIPVKDALEVFAKDTRSRTIIRAVTLIREAEKTGGNITTVLDSVARSTSQIEKLKAERRSAISAIVLEGYIIFLVFIVIMIVMDVQIIPLTSSISTISTGTQTLPGSTVIGTTGVDNTTSFSTAFLALLITQGFFAGLIIGKLSEGKIKAGIKHSFIMVAMAFLLSTLA
ncbi:MAG: type II secretion system F family protein, partial [Nanoarchaeota archaeon]